MPLSPLRVVGDRFLDARGREVLLRGVNLGGDCKVPWSAGGALGSGGFPDHGEVSFIGRPFPLEEADEHFTRLRAWGFNCLRLLTTWEAVEHAGPGRYDEAYLDYFAEIARLAGEHGFYVFVDFHQDAWSRMSGGSGAPGWTFETVGLDLERFHDADAALAMQRGLDHDLPHWPSNYRLPANRIMWSLFFGGRWLTPDFRIDGLNVQDYLQGRYLACVERMARRLAPLPHVIGFDSLNEPSLGWLGQSLSDNGAQSPSPVAVGPALSPLDGLALARGLPVTAPVIGGRETGRPRVVGQRTLNPNRIPIWREGVACPFETAGVYALNDGQAKAVDEEAFLRGPHGPFDAPRDVFAPFFRSVAETVRAHRADWILFAEVEIAAPFVGGGYPAVMPAATVNAPHWYDLANLTTRRFDVDDHIDPLAGRRLRGPEAVGASYLGGLGACKNLAKSFGGPTLIGEVGVQFAIDDAAAYRAWAAGERGPRVFAKQAQMLELMSDALDALKLSATWWNYTATNRNDPRLGDGWNQEDMSLFSRDQQDAANDGGRGTEGFARPYVRAAQGRLVRMRFDARSGAFEAVIEADPQAAGPTEIAAPAAAYPDGFKIEAPAHCRVEAADGVVRVHAGAAGSMTVSLTRHRAEIAAG
ncbi:MAG TPA: cellulase family glycosylhydrolase [Caulobacteraceae bacterium]|jgi:hypothetical protein|nr:cellulase family glycosylhydrolase [Caulobacteraceae bacterium]